MNQGFANSGVKIRVYLHCTELYSGEEIYGGTQMLTAFTRSKGTVRALLGSADVAMLMTSASNVGGVAFVGAASHPVGMCTKRGAESAFTFGHEMGHILGGDHDRQQLQKEGRSPIRSYAVGYLMRGTDKHSILAYGTGGYTRSINYYSGVGVYDSSGDATGRREADNVRVLNERRFVVSAIGDESQKCPGNCSNHSQNNESLLL